MNKFFLISFLGTALFVSCTTGQGKNTYVLEENPGVPETPAAYTIEDYKGKANGGGIPDWVKIFLADGARGVETLDAYKDRYVFMSRNEGSNFRALNQWLEGFSAELDFPRLASARIEARFRYGVPFPDTEYGSFYEALVRATSDASWTGALRQDDFWLQRKYDFPKDEQGNETPDSGYTQDTSLQAPEGNSPGNPLPKETWEFLILVTIDRTFFASQLNGLFQNLKPDPPPSKDQISAANRIKERFFEGF